jgi:hypothetical protein
MASTTAEAGKAGRSSTTTKTGHAGSTGKARRSSTTAETGNAGRTARAPAAGEILTVLAVGRVPYKVPTRIPVGAAVGIAGALITDDAEWLAYSALKVVIYPELVSAESRYTDGAVTIDGREAPVALLTDLGGEIRREYEAAKPKILAAALSRVIARAAVAEGARVAGKQAAGDSNDALVGLLAALAAEGAMVGLDKPDTRSWTLLPERVFVSRATVRPGRHTVGVQLDGYDTDRRQLDVDVPAGSAAVIVVTAPR